MCRTFARTRTWTQGSGVGAPAVRSAEMGPGNRPRPPVDADDERISLQGPRPSLSVREPDSSWRFPIWTPVRSLQLHYRKDCHRLHRPHLVKTAVSDTTAAWLTSGPLSSQSRTS